MCRLCLWVISFLGALALLTACGPRARPPAPAGAPLQPGRYVQASSFAPDFQPDEVAYTLGDFTAPPETASAAAFMKIFQDELGRAWQAQGLKLGRGEKACLLTGTIEYLTVRGTRLRWLTGRLHASLGLSGTITRGDEVLFAFRDQVNVSSPLAPGLAAPREQDLLLRQLAREAILRLLNELLLHGATGASG